MVLPKKQEIRDREIPGWADSAWPQRTLPPFGPISDDWDL